MTRAALILCVVVVLVVTSWMAVRLGRAHSLGEGALEQARLVAAEADELTRLRAAAPPESRRGKPAPGLAARLAGVVAVAGLPQSALQNVTPELESPLNTGAPGVNYRRSAVRLTLDPITLPQLGRFCDGWRKAEPGWVISAMDLTPIAGKATAATSFQKPLRAALVLETVFAQDGPASPRSTP